MTETYLLPGGARLRLAQESDLPGVVELLEADALGPDGGLPNAAFQEYLRAFETVRREQSNELWVAVDDNGDVIGTFQLLFFTTLSWNAALRAQLAGVRVAADQRGRGTGSEMVSWAVARARSKGCSVIQLSSDKRRKDAHRFYERLGFIASHEGLRRVLP